MFLAPQPSLNTTTVYYSPGVRGVAQTVAVMRKMVNEARRDPTIRQTATTVVFLALGFGDHLEVSKLLEFVQTSIRYVKDIHDVETLSTPLKTLQGRIGDCDDQSTLLAALCEAIGYPTRFVVAAYAKAGVLEHVYVQICVDGEWLDADPTERYPLGWFPPDPLTVYIERV